MIPGDAFYFDGDIHLWIVLSNPDPNGNVVIVSVTTNAPYKDSTCELNVGDHPKIRHSSLVYYRKAELASKAKLSAEVQAGKINIVQRFSDAVMSRIYDGAGLTRFMPQDCQAILDDQGLINLSP
ncbi:MAG TPA: hypothetical protein VKX17_21625 [Planctomycetota bacterium]|nr:hypothetical protein [Planctomycetota bacterium]